MKPQKLSLKALFVGVAVETLGMALFANVARTEVIPQPQPSTAPVAENNTPAAAPTSTVDAQQPQASTAPVAENNTPATAPNTNTPASTEVKILTPTSDTVLDIPSSSVVLQYAEGAKLELKVNGAVVDSNLIGRTETNATQHLVTQTWYGVSFHEGENTITAQATVNGVAGQLISVKVQVRGTATKLTVQTVEARIPADGRSTATVQGQLLDENGNRSNRDAVVTLEASAGQFVGTDLQPDRSGFQVQARQGQYTANLRSSIDAQTVRIRATVSTFEAFTQLQFETNLRPSIATGVLDVRLGARGTDYYRSFREFMPSDRKNGYELSTHGAVFATGRVLGDWLLTGAYNSDRTLNEGCNNTTNRLFRDVQSCDLNYPAYGDTSQTEVLTPSQDSLYLRLERSARIPGADPDSLMWGDYNTQEFATRSQEFSATTRQLHGFKTNYNFGNLQATAFYGNNVQGFQRDTIAPDGTSGYYFLSRRLLIGGSENIYIEKEELNRPGTVLERKQLSRGTDYEIDYDRGTILFREPILRTDVDENGQVLVRRIVATYQYEQPGSDNNIYGARAVYHISRELNRESWLGASYLRENRGVRHFDLYGADALISLGSKGNLIAEYAHSSNDSELLGLMDGSAYRVEAQGAIISGVQGRAYYRSAETGFANNATISFVPGQTRYGGQVIGRVSPTTNVRLQYDHEDNRGIAPQPLTAIGDLLTPRTEPVPGSQVDNSLTTITAGVEQQIGKATVGLDYIRRNREDRLATNPLDTNSSQLRSHLSVPINNKLTFRAQNELNLSSETDIVYPDRTILGLDWAALPGINVQLNQIFFSGGQYDHNSITSLDINGNYQLASDTTLTGRASWINAQTIAGAIGIKQGLTITPGLRADFSYEHVFGDLFNRTGAGVQFAQPFAPGQSASALGVSSGDSYSVGLAYTNNPNFQASARYEHRSSSSGSNTVISAGANGKISPALTALVRYQQASSSNQTLIGLGDTAELKLGLAYRDPNNDKFNALVRYEYRKNPSIIPDTLLLGSGTGSEDHTLAAEAIYAPDWRWEFYGKYALRESTSYLAEDLVGESTTTLAQLRATYRVGYSIDLVGEVRWLNQPTTGYSEQGLILEAGYYLTPNLRLSAGYAFGNASDRDFSGSRSASGPYLGLTVKLNELFSGFGLQKLPPPQQQESQVKPVATQQPTPAAQTTTNVSNPEPINSEATVTSPQEATPALDSTPATITSPQETNPAVTPASGGATP
jgi:hypothetical protein